MRDLCCHTTNKELHVVYASDDRFSEILGVSLTSLYESNKNMKQINIYILSNGIKNNNKEKIDLLSQKYKRSQIKWIEAKDINKELQMRVKTDRGSLSQFSRLFISSTLPSELNRVLYLDCDTIIVQSLENLWNLDMKGKTIATLNDAFSKLYRINISLSFDDIMFNSGVMLINLKKWREDNVEHKLMKFIIEKEGKIQQADQGALNAVLSRDTLCFEPKFNSVTIFYDFNYKEMMVYRKPIKGFYQENQIIDAVEHPVIIHFTTSFLSNRPWEIGCNHRYLEIWNKYKKISPWKDSPVWQNDKKIRKVINVIQHKIPRKFLIPFFGVLQAWVRPCLNMIKYN